MQVIQDEAEKLMKRRIVMDYFKNIYEPIDLKDQTSHEKYLRDVLKATGTLIHGEGDIPHVEMELLRKWREERESGIPCDVGFD